MRGLYQAALFTASTLREGEYGDRLGLMSVGTLDNRRHIMRLRHNGGSGLADCTLDTAAEAQFAGFLRCDVKRRHRASSGLFHGEGMVKQPVAALVTGKTFRSVQYALVARDGLPFPISERLLIGMCGDGMGSRVKHRLRGDKSAGIVRQRESADSRTAQTGQVSADAKFIAEVAGERAGWFLS